jgi:hypothetical protein
VYLNPAGKKLQARLNRYRLPLPLSYEIMRCEMSFHCFRCQSEISLSPGQRVGRRDECPKCKADLHVCKNCAFYEPGAYNDCRESSAERVLDKERSNMCDYFQFREGKGAKGVSAAQAAKNKLDDLFKK